MRSAIKKKLFGKNFKYAVSGGAKLSVEVTEFFDSLEIEVLEGYGLTETCVATNVNRIGCKKIGTVGQLLAPDIEIKIAEDGEIIFRGPNISLGYYNRPTATKAAWDSSGYFHTGDLGSLDQDGFLKIVGRKKEIIITSGGKNISPENVEHCIKTSIYISQAVLVGDARPYCVAILTLAHDIVAEWAKKQGIVLASDWTNDASVHKLVEGEITKINKTLASFESIKRFLIVPEFTIDNGLLTPTLKVKRKEVLKKYSAEIDKLYQRHEHV